MTFGWDRAAKSMSEESALDVAPERWRTPAIDGSSGAGYLTAGRLEELQQQAYDEAFQRGHRDGLEAAREEVQKRVERLDELLQALAEPFDRLDESVEKQLVELAMAVARQLIRRELKQDPSHVIGVVREAIRLLPIASRDVRVTLHPDDASLVRESLTAADGPQAWSIVEDPLTERGGCKVTTESSQIDAQTESRFKAVVAAIAGDERQ